MKKTSAFCVLVAVAGLGSAAPVAAERAERSNGVGVCISQLALTESLGDLASALAADRAVPGAFDGARNACGEPPGPGHVG